MRDSRFHRITLTAAALAGAVLAGCGGSRNSSDDNPPDYSLGAGDVQAEWVSSSSDVIHDRTRGALYYLDVENQNLMRIEVDRGDEQLLQSLLFEPAKLRITSDDSSLYVLESDDSAAAGDGFADIVRYDIGGDFIDTDYVELDTGVSVADFVVTTDRRVLVSTYETLVPPDVTPQAQALSLYDFFSGDLLDTPLNYGGAVTARLALNDDQQTVAAEFMYGSRASFNMLSIANGDLTERSSMNLLLAFAAYNSFEPGSNRIFRSNGLVWDDDEELELDSAYQSIDFDQDGDRIVTLVSAGGGSYLVHYYDSDSLELLSEQALPVIDDAAGMAPHMVFVDSGDLYVVYRENTASVTADWLLVQFDYPR